MSVPSCLCGGEVYAVPNPNSAEPMATYYCAACGKTLAYMPRARTAHVQAQRLAAMFPTLAPEPAVDPRTAAEDRCRAFWDSCTDFEKATLRWLSGRESWTDQRALDVRTREWRRGT